MHVRLSHKQRYTIMVTNCGTRYYSSVSYSLWVISNYMINRFNLVVTKSQNLEQLKYTVKIWTTVLSCPRYTCSNHNIYNCIFSKCVYYFFYNPWCSLDIFTTLPSYTWCLQQLVMQQQSFFCNACASILFYYLM